MLFEKKVEKKLKRTLGSRINKGLKIPRVYNKEMEKRDVNQKDTTCVDKDNEKRLK